MNQGMFEDIHGSLHRMEERINEQNALLVRILAALEVRVGELIEPQAGYLWTDSPKPDVMPQDITTFDEYNELSASQIIACIEVWDADTRTLFHMYENTHKGRATVRKAFEDAMREPETGGALADTPKRKGKAK